MKTYTPRRIIPIFGSFFRGWIVCAVISACIYNSAEMLYKNAEMQNTEVNGTINVNQTLTNNGN